MSPIKSKHASLLNDLVAMQSSLAYAARKSVLLEAEQTIKSLEDKSAPIIEVHVIGWMSRGQMVYKICLNNRITGNRVNVDTNDSWGWPESVIKNRVGHWEQFTGTVAKYFMEETQTKVVLR